jgi:type I restriction enzyme R subunit
MFNEANTVEAMVRDLLAGPTHPPAPSRFGRGKSSPPRAGEGLGEGAVKETPQPYLTAGSSGRGLGWHFVPALDLPRQPQDVFVEQFVREALIRLNPDIAAQPGRADEVLYKLRAIVLAVRSDGLIGPTNCSPPGCAMNCRCPLAPIISTSPSA